MERTHRSGLLHASVLLGALSMLGFVAGCGAEAPREPGDQANDEKVEQVNSSSHADNDGNDPFKPKRCPPGKVEGSEPGDCPPGHQ